jgi:hypothetical protein
MNIVKELNLNKNPNIVPNGSLVFAKNIKVSPDNSHITNEEGMTIAFNGKIEGAVVGIIPCIKEIVILSHLEADTGESASHIYRCTENDTTGLLDIVEVNNTWSYSGGKIVGAYTYNVNNELIISIGEYDVTNTTTKEVTESNEDGTEDTTIVTETSKVNIPLKTINLSRSTSNDNPELYSIAANIPIANIILEDKVPGSSMSNGIYQFFIRYEIDTDYYTNWFPIGGSYHAVNLENKTIINHLYDTGTNNTHTLTRCSGIYNNDNKDCNYNFKFKLHIDNNYNYKAYQIGYILKHEDTALARTWRKFGFDVEEFVFDASNFEETTTDDLTANTFNLFNVASLCNYENRLYVANYDESDYNVNLEDYAKSIRAKIIYDELPTVASSAVNTEEYEAYTFSWSTGGISSCIVEIKKPTTTTTYTRTGKGSGATVTYRTIINVRDYTALKRYFVWIATDKEDLSQFDNMGISPEYASIENLTPLSNLAIGVRGTEDLPIFDIITIPTGNTVWIFLDDVGNGYFTDHKRYSYKLNTTAHWTPTSTYRPNRFRISKSSNTRTYSTSVNVDDAVKTLMPNSVYNFFIHYVRKDGSYTNGYQLTNDILPTTITGSVTMSGAATIDTQCANVTSLKERLSTSTSGNDRDFTDLLSNNLVKDKYVYEIVSTAGSPSSTTNHKASNFGYYKNYNNDLLFKTGTAHSFSSSDSNKLYAIHIGFTNITIPDDYVGFFFSYEAPESTNNYQAYCAKTYDNLALFKASEVEVGNINYNGSIYVPEYKITSNGYSLPSTNPAYINDAGIVVSNAIESGKSTNSINAAGSDGGIVLNLKNKDTNVTPEIGEVGNIITFNRNIYCKKDKQLVSFGPVCYKHSDIETYSYADNGNESDFPNNYMNGYDFNYPAYFVNDKCLVYDRPVYITETGKVYDISSDNSIAKTWTTSTDEYARIITYKKFSRVNTNAISIKKEPEYLVGVLGDETSGVNTHEKSVNFIVKPINATDLIELKDSYVESYYKVYTNYKENLNYDSYKRATIRRSDVIGDESLANAWRHFQSNNYKVLSKNKGNITNILGMGNAFFVHTEHSLFYFSRDNLLKTSDVTAQLKMPDLFDVEPIELFTSNHGYGGLQYSQAWTVNSNGYWFVDADNKRIYNFDNNHLTDLTSDILSWMDNVQIADAHMVTDFNNARVIMCLAYYAEDVGNKELNQPGYITLSFNMISKKFVSIHDYKFSIGTNTKNHCYFYYAVAGANSSYIYCFHKNAPLGFYGKIGDYNGLDDHTYGFPAMSTNVTVKKDDSTEETRTVHPAIFDIIINENYTVPKCINSISYILNQVYAYWSNKVTRMAEPLMGNGTYADTEHYSGDLLRIYSDSNDTGNLDISNGDKINDDTVNRSRTPNYKVPFYDKGIWNFNYIRNYISKELTKEEICARYGLDSNNLTSTQETKIATMLANPSDERNLLYGRYFVIRFIFRNIDNVAFRFEDLNINYSKY